MLYLYKILDKNANAYNWQTQEEYRENLKSINGNSLKVLDKKNISLEVKAIEINLIREYLALNVELSKEYLRFLAIKELKYRYNKIKEKQ